MKNKTSIIILVITFIIIAFGALKVAKMADLRKLTVEDKKKIFKPAPDFALFDIYGEKKHLSDFSGNVVILDFWATWCPPCKAEIPHFIELYNEYKDEGLEIIGVALDWNAERVVRPFAEENGITYTLLLGDEKVGDLYGGIISIPTTFLIDRKGGIRKKYIGYRDKEVFEKDIKELL